MRNSDQIPDYLGGVRLLRVIGTGGYGDVWLGLDGVDSPVAVKVIDRRQIRAEAVSREERAMRLIRDGLADHPNLVRMRHVGSEGDLFFYSMDLADPQDPDSPAPGNEYRPTTLQSLLAPGVPLPIDECVRICGQILDGLEHLHKNGIVHRDMKPANVLLLGGCWQLADFGLATHDQTEMTTVGTVGYIAPNGPLGRSGDLYAVGKILYSMLTGAAVSEYPSISKAYQGSSERVRFGRVLRVINRACHHLPEKRFGVAEELKAALAVAADQKRVARRRGVGWGSLVAGIAVSAYAFGISSGEGKPLSVGDSIQHVTLPALIRETENGPVPIVIDNSGGQRMTAQVHRKLTWSAGDGGNGHTYMAVLVSPDADQWSVNDARYIATSLGGYLVSLNTPEENRWVFENLADDKPLWRDWVSEVVPLMYRTSAPEYFDDSGVRKLFEFSEEAQAFYDSHYSVDPADTYRIMLPCSNGPLIGLTWKPRADQAKGQGEFVWDDGQPLDYGSWIPNRNTLDYAESADPDPAGIVIWNSNLGPRLNREKMYLSAFGFSAEGKNSPAMTWWVQDWSNPPLAEEPNRFISFIVEIP